MALTTTTVLLWMLVYAYNYTNMC